MLRPVALALAATLAAAPAFAQSASPAAYGPSPGQTDQAADDGTSAMAQQEDQQGPGPAPLLIGGVMVGWTIFVGVLIADVGGRSTPTSP